MNFHQHDQDFRLLCSPASIFTLDLMQSCFPICDIKIHRLCHLYGTLADFSWTALNSFFPVGEWVAHAASSTHLSACSFLPMFCAAVPRRVCNSPPVQKHHSSCSLFRCAPPAWVGLVPVSSRDNVKKSGGGGGASKHTHTSTHAYTPTQTHIHHISQLNKVSYKMCFVTSRHFHNS